jgi:hypothetical protein
MPADTFSTDAVGLMLMGTGNDNNVWGIDYMIVFPNSHKILI